MDEEIKNILFEYAEDELGIYPISWNGIPRTLWKTGWNDAVIGDREIPEHLSDEGLNEYSDGYESALNRIDENKLRFVQWYNVQHPDDKKIFDIFAKEECLHLLTNEKDEIVMTVNTSDIFSWGYANADIVSFDDLREIYKLKKQSLYWAIVKWKCFKENIKPQYPLIWDMYQDGEWDEKMMNLKDNEYNTRVGWLQFPTNPWQK